MNKIIYMPMNSYFLPLFTVKEAVDFYNYFYEDFNCGKVLKLIKQTKIRLNKSIKNLSSGM